jgi:hypothetical protein
VWSRPRSRGFAGLGSGRSGAVGCCTSLLYCWLPRPRCLVELTASSSRIRSTVCAGLGQLVYVLVAVGLRRLGQHRITRSSPRFPRRSRHGGHAERLPPAGLPVAQAPPCHAARPGRHDGRTATRPRTLLSRPRGMVAFGARRGGRPYRNLSGFPERPPEASGSEVESRRAAPPKRCPSRRLRVRVTLGLARPAGGMPRSDWDRSETLLRTLLHGSTRSRRTEPEQAASEWRS